jgi:anti-anti-sigma factor
MARGFNVQRDDHGIYHLQGEVSIHALGELKDFLEKALQSAHNELCVSLEKVRFIDTASLQMLLVFKKSIGPGVALRICGVSAEVENILSLCGLRAVLL